MFNHGATVRAVAQACRSKLSHVVVVDDGSTDVDVGALLPDLNVIRHSRNQGKGQALLTALRYVHAHGGRAMITLDADGQHHPDDIESLLATIVADPDALVIGVRHMNAPTVPSISRLGMRLSNFWVKLETGVQILDSQSGFRAYPVEAMLRLPLHGHRYEFETEILVKAIWSGVRIKQVDVSVTYAEKGMRQSHFRKGMDTLRIIACHLPLLCRSLWMRKRRTAKIIFQTPRA